MTSDGARFPSTGALLDSALRVLPSALLQRPVPGLQLSPLARALLLTPLRALPVALSLAALWVLCVLVPDMLDSGRGGFEAGFRQQHARSNEGGSELAASLRKPLAAWSGLALVFHAARTAALVVGFLLLFEKGLAAAAVAGGAVPELPESGCAREAHGN